MVNVQLVFEVLCIILLLYIFLQSPTPYLRRRNIFSLGSFYSFCKGWNRSGCLLYMKAFQLSKLTGLMIRPVLNLEFSLHLDFPLLASSDPTGGWCSREWSYHCLSFISFQQFLCIPGVTTIQSSQFPLPLYPKAWGVELTCMTPERDLHSHD